MNAGDVIKFGNPGWKHYAIFIGMGQVAGNDIGEDSVIHWWKDVGMLEPSVLITPFQRLADNMNHEIAQIEDGEIDFTQVVTKSVLFKTILDTLKNDTENFIGLFDNSYHFVNWCRNGLRSIDITPQDIMNVRDPRRFVHGYVTNKAPLPRTLTNLRNLHPGDIIRLFHRDYEHWALYLQNQAAVSRVIHWSDRDSVESPSIAIQDLNQILGCCEAEIVKYEGRNPNGQRAAAEAKMFINIVAQFPNIANLFKDSKQFAFWYCFGLGSVNLDEIPVMNTEEDVNNFVNGLMKVSDPDVIRRDHNTAIKNMLSPGDLISFSQGSQKHFGLYTEGKGIPSVMCWRENDPPTIMIDPFNAISENMKVMIEHKHDDFMGVINKDEMVNRAYALRTIIMNTRDDCNGLFANSKHCTNWIFSNYGLKDARITLEEIAEVTDVWQHIYKFKPSRKTLQDKVLIRQQNRNMLNVLQEGELVKFYRKRKLYKHYAVYVGNDEDTGAPSVIHWYKDSRAPSDSKNPRLCIRSDLFWTVARYNVSMNGYSKKYENSDINGREVVERAKRFKSEFEKGTPQRPRYSLLWNNCEHFANDCRYRKHYSRQTRILRNFNPCCQ